MSVVRPFQTGDVPAAAAIVRGLPDYFTKDVPDRVEHDAARHQAWVITDSGTVAGFAIAARKSSAGAEILRVDHLGADGISVVAAKTLDRSSGYRPTRPPGPSGNATASSTSTRSIRCPAGSPATRRQST